MWLIPKEIINGIIFRIRMLNLLHLIAWDNQIPMWYSIGGYTPMTKIQVNKIMKKWKISKLRLKKRKKRNTKLNKNRVKKQNDIFMAS